MLLNKLLYHLQLKMVHRIHIFALSTTSKGVKIMKKKVFYSILVLFVAIISGLVGETIGENRSKETATIAGFEAIQLQSLNNLSSDSEIYFAMSQAFASAAHIMGKNNLISKEEELKINQQLLHFLEKAQKKLQNVPSKFEITLQNQKKLVSQNIKDIKELKKAIEFSDQTKELLEQFEK